MSAAAAGGHGDASSARRWVRVEFEGHNNTLAVLHLHIGQRVRVELGPEAATAAATPNSPVATSTDEELARTAKATVRYIGPVAAARDPTATMVGIEWDEGAARGRNDGSVAGVRYFRCEHAGAGVKAGSFIQPSRVRTGESNNNAGGGGGGGGQSLLRAIELKYETRFKQDANASLYLVAEYNKAKESLHNKSIAVATGAGPAATLAPTQMSGTLAPDGSARHIPVTFQGEEYMQNKIAAQLASLRDMTLTQGHIGTAVEPVLPPSDANTDDHTPSEEEQLQTLSAKIPHCATLDLTDNLLRDWSELGRMVSALPSLTLLAVSNNNLLYESLFEPSSSSLLLRPSLSASFVRLEVLVLNSVPDAWASAVALARHGALPNLQELHLCKNNITNLSSALQQQQQRTNSNPKATNADSASATVSSSAAMAAELAALFPSLRTLELSFNALRDWAEVRLLERLPKLSKLLLNDNVLTSVEYDSGDYFSLASAPASSASAASSSSSAAAASASSTDSSSSSPANAPFGALVSLGLNSNDLASFDSVTALSRFPALRELRAQGNLKLEQITMSLNSAAGSAGAAGASAAAAAAAGGAPTAPVDPFQAAIQQLLSSVSIDGAHNLVSTFGDAAVAAAARAPAPTAAVAAPALSAPSDAAFVSSRESAALLRFQLIARLPRVTSLNRSALSARERIDAEKYYVLTACQALHRLTPAQREALLKPMNPADGTTGAGDRASAAAAGPLRGVDALFPRYTELVAAHGDPAPTMSALQKAQMEPSGSTLASKLVEVTLVLAEPSSVAPSAEDAPAPPSSIPLPATLPGLRVRAAASKKLSSSLTVQAARQLLDKTFKLPAHRKAAYVMQWYEGTFEAGADAAAHPLDEPLKSLNYFGVCNGAFIVLLRKD